MSKNRQKVRKTDMITLGENSFEYRGGGLFTTEDIWIHPIRREITYEIIYVLGGEIYLYEEDTKYVLTEKNLIILEKDKEHGGYAESYGKTAFYWIHFDADDISDFQPDFRFLRSFSASHLFRKLLHYDNHGGCPDFTCDVLTAQILCEAAAEAKTSHCSSKLVSEIYEWIRINATDKLSAEKVAVHFSYNSEYISRLLKKEYKKTLKQIINNFTIEKAKSYLTNTNYSVKEIAALLDFPDSTAFINFFKYHENTTPSAFRNSYGAIHMNKK